MVFKLAAAAAATIWIGTKLLSAMNEPDARQPPRSMDGGRQSVRPRLETMDSTESIPGAEGEDLVAQAAVSIAEATALKGPPQAGTPARTPSRLLSTSMICQYIWPYDFNLTSQIYAC